MENVKIVDWRGIRGLVAAELLTDDADGITFGEVRRLCGTSNISKTTETNTGTKYYDNVPAININSAGVDEVQITGSAIDEETEAWMQGEFYDEATGMRVEGEPETKYFALGYIPETTDGVERYVWRLKGTFSSIEVEHNTKDDGTDSTGSSFTFTGVNTQHKFAKTGKTAKAVVVRADKFAAGEEAFFAAVLTPDTVETAAT